MGQQHSEPPDPDMPPPPPAGRTAPRLERPVPRAAWPEPDGPRRFLLAIVLGILVVAGAAVAGFLLFLRGDPGDPGSSLAAPRGFAADPQPFRVELTWQPPRSAQGYSLFRDGELIETLPRDATSFVDDTVLPLQGFTYEIEAFSADVTSVRERVEVQTPAAPLGLSRLEGLYRVTAHDTRDFGFVVFDGDFRTGWRFRPQCGDGACDVGWTDVNLNGFETVLRQSGPRYSGSDRAEFGRCGGRKTRTTWTIRLHVTNAATVKDAWRATAFEGTIAQRSPAQLGCVATGADYTIKGALQR